MCIGDCAQRSEGSVGVEEDGARHVVGGRLEEKGTLSSQTSVEALKAGVDAALGPVAMKDSAWIRRDSPREVVVADVARGGRGDGNFAAVGTAR